MTADSLACVESDSTNGADTQIDADIDADEEIRDSLDGLVGWSRTPRPIGSVENGLQLVPQKIGDQAPMDAADLFQGCRLLVFEEAEEGLDGRQPNIARHRRVFALDGMSPASPI